MRALSINVVANRDNAHVSFVGILDEESDLLQLDLSPYREVTFDLKQLDRINSRGLRLWLNWMSGLDKSKKYIMENCPKVLVTQANMVKGVFPTWVKVRSVDLPYFCERCQMPFAGTIVLDENESIPDEVENTAACPTCKQVSEIDAADTYFRFLENR